MHSREGIAHFLGPKLRGFKANVPERERGIFPNNPPRSMTDEELKYYAKHKHLNPKTNNF